MADLASLSDEELRSLYTQQASLSALSDDELKAAYKKASAITPKSERSLGEEALRQGGLFLRSAAHASVSIPAIVSDAVTGVINEGADLVAGKGNGFRFQRADAALDNLMNKAGLPQPENATERVVQDINSGAGAGGAFAQAGKLASKAGSKIVSEVAEKFAQGLGLQIVSGGAGSGAAGATREAGGGPVVQGVAGLVGSLAPVGKAAIVQTGRGSKQLFDAAKKAHDLGYVIPPADLNPSMLSEAASGLSGKIKTAQEASFRNQKVTNDLTKKALGLSETDELNREALEGIRRQAAQSYDAIAAAGTVTPGPSYAKAIDDAVAPFVSQSKSFPGRKVPTLVDDIQALKTVQFDAGDALATIRVLRNETDAAYRAGDKMAGKAYKDAALALEQALDDHLVATNAPAGLIDGFRRARQKIAQTYTVEAALNPQTGNVNAIKLASDLTKNKPLTGELRVIAEVAQAFPKATQALKEAPKSLSPLDFVAGAGVAAGAQNPLLLATTAARPIARNVLLSKPVQNAAVNGSAATNVKPPGITAGIIEAPSHLDDGEPKPAAPKAGIEKISQAATVDEAIAGAFEAINGPAAQAEPVAIAEAPKQDPVAEVVAQADGTLMESPAAPSEVTASAEPASTWYGRRGDGYQSPNDALMAMRTRQKVAPELDWKAERMPNGAYRLAGYQRTEQPGAMSAGGLQAQMNPTGTATISGDPQQIAQTLRANGITSFIPTPRGVLVAVSQAQKAMQLAGATA